MLESPGRDDQPWWLGGRRVQVRGSDRAGFSELQAPGAVLVQGVQLRVAGVAPELTAIRFTPDEIVRVLRAGSVELTERIAVALDHGLVYWGIVADAPVPITLHWTSPLPQRPRPTADPAITSDDPVPEPPDLAPTIRLGNSVNGLTVVACAGTVQRTSGGAGSLCVAEGDRMLRLVFAGGTLAGEVQRGEEAFARRRLRAFRQDRILHARRLEQRLTALESVDAMLDRAVHWAKIRLDASVCEITGTGRLPRLPGQDGGIVGACEIAGAALAIGDREIALDLLRALGRAGVDGVEARNAVGELVREYLAWTADQGSIERLVLPAGDNERDVVPVSGTSWDDSVLIRSVTGYRLEADRSSSRLLRAVVQGLWGITPDALNFGLTVRPSLPTAWPEMALRRLRIGGSLLDLRLRRRPGRLVLRVELLQGPRPRMIAELPPNYPVSQVTLDDEALGGSRATFEVAGSHEVSFYLIEGREP